MEQGQSEMAEIIKGRVSSRQLDTAGKFGLERSIWGLSTTYDGTGHIIKERTAQKEKVKGRGPCL